MAPLKVLAALAALPCLEAAADGGSCPSGLAETAAGGSPGCAASWSQTGHPWPMKGGSPLRTGASARPAPRAPDLSKDSWRFELNSDFGACEVPYTFLAGCCTLASIATVSSLWCCCRCWRTCCCRKRCRHVLFSYSSLVTLLSVGTLALLVVADCYPATCGHLSQTPVIDASGNIYVGTTSGWLLSLASNGTLRWGKRLGPRVPLNGMLPVPALDGDVVYSATGSGEAVALKQSTGEELWRFKYSGASGLDPWSVGLLNETILVIGFQAFGDDDQKSSGSHVTALCLNGTVRWRFKMAQPAYNFAPVMTGSIFALADRMGTAYGLEPATGRLRWHSPGEGDSEHISTGGVAASPDGKVLFVTANLGGGVLTRPGRGLLRALDAESGAVLWRKEFDLEANLVPVLYTAGGPQGKLAVLVALGSNPELPWPYAAFRPPAPDVVGRGRLDALDATGGSLLWSFEPPPKTEWPETSPRGATPFSILYTEAWTAPTVAAGGEVILAGWHGGLIFSLDGATGKERARRDLGIACRGQLALAADGSMVAATFREIWHFPRQRPR